MKWLYSTIIILIFAGSISAQGLVGVSYNVSIPTADLKDYISDVSWRGFSLEGRWFAERNITFGVTFGWNIFSKKSNELIQIEDGEVNGAVSGTQVRSVNVFPIVGTFHYYIGDWRDQTRFYLGTSLGLYYIRQRLEIGISAVDNNNMHFGLAPEAGVLIELSRAMTMVVRTKYDYAFSSGTALSGSSDNAISYYEFGIGFLFQSF